MEENGRDKKHMTLEERMTIEEMLGRGASLVEIAATIGRAPSTVSREIKSRRQRVERGSKRLFNRCKPVDCKLVDRFPHCCNGCPERRHCTLDGYRYFAKVAEERYRATLVESRSGIDMTSEEFERLDEVVTAGVKAGKSPETILMENPDLGVSPRTIYRYIEQGILSVKNIDLRRKVSYAPRRKKRPYEARNWAIYQGRTFEDYTRYVALHPGVPAVQMDTVMGAQSCKRRLLTLEFIATHLMLVRLLERGTPEHVIAALAGLAEILEPRGDAGVRAVLLTDRGSEFSRPEEIEALGFRVFYCDASCPWQKGGVESNHRLLRYVFPKSSDFDSLTPELVSRVESILANIRRRSISSYTPLQLGRAQLGDETIDRLNLKEVDAGDIDLRPQIGRRKQTLK